MLSLHPLLAGRWSPARFDPSHVAGEDEVTVLLEAARWAPSAGNSQPWAFIVGRRGDGTHARLVAHMTLHATTVRRGLRVIRARAQGDRRDHLAAGLSRRAGQDPRLLRAELLLVGGQPGLVLGGVNRAQDRPTGLQHGLHLGPSQFGSAFLAAVADLLDAVFFQAHGRRV